MGKDCSINNTGTGWHHRPYLHQLLGTVQHATFPNAGMVHTIISGVNAGDRFAAHRLRPQRHVRRQREAGSSRTLPRAKLQNPSHRARHRRLYPSCRGKANSPELDWDPCDPYTSAKRRTTRWAINSNTLQDCAGVNNGPALPGTACNDGNKVNTGNDTRNHQPHSKSKLLDCAVFNGCILLPGIRLQRWRSNTVRC